MSTTAIRSRNGVRLRAGALLRMSPDQVNDLAEELEGRPVPGVRLSEEQFVAWVGGEIKAEWVDGEIFLMAPVSDEHSDLNVWLMRLMGDFIENHDLGNVRLDMFLRLPTQRRLRVPDFLFVSKERKSIVRKTFVEGAPDLIVEIVSPDSQSRDRREKFQEYEKAGVREYWMVDPMSQVLEVYRLVGKKFQLIQERDGVVASSVLKGFRLKSAALWQRPLPKVAGVLRWMRTKG